MASARRIEATPGLSGKAPALEAGLAANLGAMRSLAQAHGALWMDWPTGLWADSLFQDHCHPTVAGEALKARLVADALVAAAAPVRPVRRR